jgi:hypothetical protein
MRTEANTITARKGDMILSHDNTELLGMFRREINAPRQSSLGYDLRIMTWDTRYHRAATPITGAAPSEAPGVIECVLTRVFKGPDRSYWHVRGGIIPRSMFEDAIAQPGRAQERALLAASIDKLLINSPEGQIRGWLEYQRDCLGWLSGNES